MDTKLETNKDALTQLFLEADSEQFFTSPVKTFSFFIDTDPRSLSLHNLYVDQNGTLSLEDLVIELMIREEIMPPTTTFPEARAKAIEYYTPLFEVSSKYSPTKYHERIDAKASKLLKIIESCIGLCKRDDLANPIMLEVMLDFLLFPKKNRFSIKKDIDGQIMRKYIEVEERNHLRAVSSAG